MIIFAETKRKQSLMEIPLDNQESLDNALRQQKDICCSEGILTAFPEVLHHSYYMKYIGLIVCHKGHFTLQVNKDVFPASAGNSIFISEESRICIREASDDLQVHLLFYKIHPIREILGSSVMAMHLYALQTPALCYVWSTGAELDITHYISLISRHRYNSDNPFDQHEFKLLLLALTYRLCSLFSRKLTEGQASTGHKADIFIQLVRPIDQYYPKKRSVDFYADKLCLTPKYLSALSKSVCGHTVQELIFKALVRRSIFLLKNSNKSIQEISDELSFPNASSFGTFFKKQTGLSPKHYRQNTND